MRFGPAGTMILAGVQDGTNAACEQSNNGVVASIVTKHAGKAFGACANANAATRNGLARYAFGRDMVLDDVIRLFDCLASLPKMEIFSINQIGLENEINQMQAAKSGRAKGADSGSEARAGSQAAAMTGPKLSALDLAAKRFFNGMYHNAMEVPGGMSIWEYVTHEGIPFAINQKTFWYAFRQHWLTKQRVREDLTMYNGEGDVREAFKTHGAGPGWKKLLDHLVLMQAAERSNDSKVVYMRFSGRAHLYLRDVLLADGAESYEQIPSLQALPLPDAGLEEFDEAGAEEDAQDE